MCLDAHTTQGDIMSKRNLIRNIVDTTIVAGAYASELVEITRDLSVGSTKDMKKRELKNSGKDAARKHSTIIGDFLGTYDNRIDSLKADIKVANKAITKSTKRLGLLEDESPLKVELEATIVFFEDKLVGLDADLLDAKINKERSHRV